MQDTFPGPLAARGFGYHVFVDVATVVDVVVVVVAACSLLDGVGVE